MGRKWVSEREAEFAAILAQLCIEDLYILRNIMLSMRWRSGSRVWYFPMPAMHIIG